MSALDDLLGGGFILRDGSGAQVEGVCSDLQVVGVATVSWDAVNLRHVIDVGALGSAVPNSVWFYNGTTGTWSTAPVLTSVSAGSAPAASGAFRMGNGDALIARDNVGDDFEMVAMGTDNLPRFSGVRYPSPAFINSGTVGSVVSVTADGVLGITSLGALGALTRLDTATTIKTPRDVNSDAAFDYTIRGALHVPHTTSTPLPAIAESDYAGMGASNASVTYQVATITLEVTGNDGNVGSPAFFQQTFKGTIFRLRTGGDAWSIGTNLTHITGLDIGTPAGGISAVMTLSGATNGDITIDLSYSYTSDPQSDWVYRVNVLGGGRYAP